MAVVRSDNYDFKINFPDVVEARNNFEKSVLDNSKTIVSKLFENDGEGRVIDTEERYEKLVNEITVNITNKEQEQNKALPWKKGKYKNEVNELTRKLKILNDNKDAHFELIKGRKELTKLLYTDLLLIQNNAKGIRELFMQILGNEDSVSANVKTLEETISSNLQSILDYQSSEEIIKLLQEQASLETEKNRTEDEMKKAEDNLS